MPSYVEVNSTEIIQICFLNWGALKKTIRIGVL